MRIFLSCHWPTPADEPSSQDRDTGETWERVDLGDVPPSRMAKIAIDRGAPALVCCCAQLGHVYISQDGGQAWTKTRVPVELSRSRHIYPMVCR